MQYRRAKQNGGTYFITMVTHKRNKFLCHPENISLLRSAFIYAKGRHPFEINATVILPDHTHYIMTLPDVDADFPTRIRLIKTFFSRRFNDGRIPTTNSRIQKQERAIWQRRYWEHVIRDDDDYRKHVEYIHYNPVKHGLAPAPHEWKYSSFHHYVRQGIYDVHWGAGERLCFDGDVGAE